MIAMKLAIKTLLFTLITFLSIGQILANEYAIKKVWILEINSSINPAVLNYLEHNFKQMKAANGDLALIKMNTPGGLVTTTKDILTLMGTQDFPVAVWITPEGASATSAGAIIASGAHLLYMSEGTNIGAATPIGMGKDIEQKVARSKAINDLVALVTSLSKARGRNPIEFAAMIEEAKSFDAREAKEKKIITDIANTQVDLLNSINGAKVTILGKEVTLQKADGVEIESIDMDPGQKILNVLANPMTAYILFIIGAALIYFEMQAPGGIVAGALGAVCLVIAAISFQVLPLNYGALGLIALSFILFILEIYITSYGILTLTGIACLVGGSLFLYRTHDAFIDIQLPMVLSVVAAVVLYVLFVGTVLFRTRTKKEDFFSNKEHFGQIGKILPDEGDQKCYMIKVNGEIWKARSKDQFEVGETVKITHADDDHMFLSIQKA